MNIRFIIFTIFIVFTLFCKSALAEVWQPTAGHTQIPIWPTVIPDAQATKPEIMKLITDHLVAGKPWIKVSNVSQPTITVYSPKAKSSGTAVMVFPGGGYEILAMDLEGTEVCDWLTSKGITCVLLKYRVPGEQYYSTLYPKSGPYPESPIALEDAQRAMGLVRLNATKWHIDPHKIGVLGFSSGGHLVTAISTHYQKRLYKPVDNADKQSCRPDFAVAIYPGHLTLADTVWDKNFGKNYKSIPTAKVTSYKLNPDVPVDSQTPPTFLLQAENDNEDNVDDSLVYYIALKNAKISAEMHLYADGGHAFGLRPTNLPITHWPQLVERWLNTIGMLNKKY